MPVGKMSAKTERVGRFASFCLCWVIGYLDGMQTVRMLLLCAREAGDEA
jgi:hypothetical protein